MSLKLTPKERDTLLIVAAGALLFFVPKFTQMIAQQAVKAAGGVVTGAVVGAGEVVGVPATSVDQCAADVAAGRTWDASFSCPAVDFLKYIF